MVLTKGTIILFYSRISPRCLFRMRIANTTLRSACMVLIAFHA